VSGFFAQLGFLAPGWKDLLEILLVATVLYRILLVLAGTRAIQLLLGLVLLVGVYFLARVLQLGLIRYLLANLFEFGAFAALVVFQPELRSALAHLGRNRVLRFFSRLEELRFFSRLEESAVAEEIALTAEDLARSGVGAIIAIERQVGLGEYAETGTMLQARVSSPLLASIFAPYAPLHDGAVIIRGDLIVAAGAILPLTQFPVVDKSIGTRHRAALGLSEETDALIIVVSEETSTISIASHGTLRRGLDREQLLEAISSTKPSVVAVTG
jgi:diadenylate cyclase